MPTVITSLLTSRVDPQRGVKWDPDLATIDAWQSSIRGAKAVVLADEASGPTVVHVPGEDISPYRARWFRALEYLQAEKDDWVWVTDGSDVVMLREPWGEMADGLLYVGSEPTTVGCSWMIDNHPSKVSQDWMKKHRHLPLLNAGLVGGSYETVLSFLELLCQELEVRDEESDMAAFNAAARQVTHHTGETVHTVFKAYQDNGIAWWMHK